MADWEDDAREDAFPTAGTTYYLRCQGEPRSKLYARRDGGEYKKVKVTWWMYTDEDHLDSFKVLSVEMYSGSIAEFAGRWQQDRLYKVKCQLDGKKKLLHIMETYPLRDAQPTKTASQGPLSPGPSAQPVTAAQCVSPTAAASTQSTPGEPGQQRDTGQGATPPCGHEKIHRTPTGWRCDSCAEEVQP